MIEMDSPPKMASVLSEACIVVNPWASRWTAGTLELSGINDRMVQRTGHAPKARADIFGVERDSWSTWNGLDPAADGSTSSDLFRGGQCLSGDELPRWASPSARARQLM